MTNPKDIQQTILRNKLIGRWAAEKLGIIGRDADIYADALARDAVDPERSDVFSKIRREFDAAGVAMSDEQIRRVMTDFMLKAGNLMLTKQGDNLDAAAVALARNLMSR
ncbi:ATPase inhibitor subunit zeta [Microvirga mediterraneensis]|uniref:DUF1476 family protein n=1 Tax=Microvirga mediterraneensis TaxID=2754695 RepID=A0A838BMR8_9HYPH|nr:ATPase inhibitor subunit zeta [Microvirga mediterraneensis]MBA1156827.1 DUF1476 family protein [Microvirga mediterraneensis]